MSNFSSLREQVEKLTKERDKATRERDEYRKLFELVSLELKRFKAQLFGKKSEKVPSEQLTLKFLELAEAVSALQEPEEEPTPNAAGPHNGSGANGRKKHPGRRPLPEDLPVVEIVVTPPEVEGAPEQFVKIGEEVCETLEYRSASFVRVRTVRPKFARKGNGAQTAHESGESPVVIADVPDKPIPKALAGPALLAHVLTSKYADHLPLHRLETIFRRQGIELSRSTLCGWVKQSAELLRAVVDAMLADAKTLSYIATDATGVLVQNKEQCHKGHFWVMIGEDRHVLFNYTRDHDSAAVDSMFADYQGTILADAATVYDHLFLGDDRTEAGCWAHARRYYFKALSSEDLEQRRLAGEAITKMKAIFQLEKSIASLGRKKKEAVRKKRGRKLVEDYFQWCDDQWATVEEKTPIYSALLYSRNQREALKAFLKDGRLPAHNNLSELQLRREVVGRKNWLFLGSEEGAQWNTTVVSLIASCQLHGIEPWSYLRDVLCLLPSWNSSRVLELAPAFFKKTLEQDEAQQILAANVFRDLPVAEVDHRSTL